MVGTAICGYSLVTEKKLFVDLNVSFLPKSKN